MVLANPDLERIIRTVEVRTTPVVIAQQLHWAPPHSVRADSKTFEDALQAWRGAKASGDLNHGRHLRRGGRRHADRSGEAAILGAQGHPVEDIL